MKHSHKCPKCESEEIFKVPGPAAVGYSTNTVPKSWFKGANVDRYVCSVCGFSEEWIAKARDLAALRKKYGKIEDLDEFV